MIRLEYFRSTPSIIWTTSRKSQITQLGTKEIIISTGHSQVIQEYTNTYTRQLDTKI